MNFNIYGWVTLIVIMVICLFAVSEREGGGELNETQQKFTETLYEPLNNLTSETLPYVNPYDGNMTFKKFVINTAHLVLYPIIMELHNVVGYVTQWAWKTLPFDFVFKTINIVIAIMFLWLGTRLIKPVGAFYVLYDEHFRRKGKEKKTWWLITISILSVLLVGILFVGIVLWVV